ncbi:MAG TPA: M67 family metallopeptidase [Solirubrobacteraceae bacterium]|nr:M67 family metallopeptidase [Solirubrobacteraceae bacterium]
MRIARLLLDQIVAQARDEAPNECCGIVGSRDGRAVTLFKARNARASPLAYDIDGRDLQRIYDEIDRNGLEVGIIYHSHTRSDPVPSQTDINLASPFLPDAVYMIVGVKDPERDDIRAWHIRDGQVTEAQLAVEEG